MTRLVLGVFIATFTYSLLVLRAVRAPVDNYDRFVPGASVSVALLLCTDQRRMPDLLRESHRTFGYVQAVDEHGVTRLAHEHGLVVEMRRAIGDFVLEGETLAEAWPRDVPVK